MKRILSIQPVAERGGSDQALARMVRSLAGGGWECHIALPAPSPMAEKFAAAGATLHVVPMRRITTSGSPLRWAAYAGAWPVAVTRLAALARRIDADVIHSNSLHSWYGWAVATLLRKPHVWHAREIVVQSPTALRLERWLAKHAATRVIAISNPVAAQLDGPNVVIVHDEADPDEFSPQQAGVFRAQHGIPDTAPLVGAVGRIDTWKGLDVLLDAVPTMQAAQPTLQVVIAGPTVLDKEGYADQLAARAGALPGVHWLGPRSDVAELLADLDVFVLASTLPEPFGLVVIEALASGVPVVATAAGGPLEILAEAGPAAGRLIPPEDAAELSAAVLSLLGSGETSTSIRQGRSRLGPEPPTGTVSFAGVFDEVLATRPGVGLGPPRSGAGRGHRPGREGQAPTT
ncbi:MAG TPA: glycosyltransferase family 4 protein [Acidimicrobiales bacterium]